MLQTKAKQSFDENIKDVDRLFEIYEDITGKKKGSHHNLDPISKAAFISLCASWEVYVEDICKEGIRHITSMLKRPDLLSKRLKERVIRELRADKDDRRFWRLAGDGWKELAVEIVDIRCGGASGGFNTPKSAPICDLFQLVFGVDDIAKAAWSWQGMSPEMAVRKLDRLVALRGELAHGRYPGSRFKRRHVDDFKRHVLRLVEHTDEFLLGKLPELRAPLNRETE